MVKSGNTIAVIPAKSRSRRVPGKNMRPFNGKPLLQYSIEEALKCRSLDEVYVSTDSPEIQAFSERMGAKAPFLRPPELCGDDVHASAPILHLLETLGGPAAADFCVMLLPTSPLRKASTIGAIVELSRQRRTNVLSVTPLGKTIHHLRTIEADGTMRRVGPAVFNFQTQDSPPLSYINGSCYCVPVEALLRHRTFQYGEPTAYEMDSLEAYDIDSEADFRTLERVARTLVEA